MLPASSDILALYCRTYRLRSVGDILLDSGIFTNPAMLNGSTNVETEGAVLVSIVVQEKLLKLLLSRVITLSLDELPLRALTTSHFNRGSHSCTSSLSNQSFSPIRAPVHRLQPHIVTEGDNGRRAPTLE